MLKHPIVLLNGATYPTKGTLQGGIYSTRQISIQWIWLVIDEWKKEIVWISSQYNSKEQDTSHMFMKAANSTTLKEYIVRYADDFQNLLGMRQSWIRL